MRFAVEILIMLALLGFTLLLIESGANACEEAGGKIVRNGLGEFVACINKE